MADGLPEAAVARLGEQYRAALSDELRRNPEAFELRATLEAAGHRLIDAVEAVRTNDPAVTGDLPDGPADARVDAFVALVTERVAGPGGLIADAVTRTAAAHAARQLVERSPSLRHQVRTGESRPGRVADGVFCEIYRIFFADAVTSFFHGVIAAKVTLAIPVLPVVDPAGVIANWIADKVTSLIPTPCDNDSDGGASPLADVGRGLVKETVERALGISPGPTGG